MGEVMGTFLRPKAVEEGSDTAPRRGDVAEQGFELGKDLFNRIEIGRVRRKETQRGPTRLMAARTAGTSRASPPR